MNSIESLAFVFPLRADKTKRRGGTDETTCGHLWNSTDCAGRPGRLCDDCFTAPGHPTHPPDSTVLSGVSVRLDLPWAPDPIERQTRRLSGLYGPTFLARPAVVLGRALRRGLCAHHVGIGTSPDPPEQSMSFLTDLYLSGTTFFTLGLGDVTPLSGVGRFLVVTEVAFGFIFLALVISYVPVIYQAFSRRELRISLLDARAGSPATAVELLRRNCAGKDTGELRLLLHDWEVWCADILESHLSYPILAFYRSQHEPQSWVEALTVILDTCALVLTSMEDAPLAAARFTFAAERHAVVDLAQVLNTSPTTGVNRLSSAEFAQVRGRLAAAGIRVQESTASEQKLEELRATYELFVSALAERIQVSLPPWIPPADVLDDWQTSAWDDQFPSIHQTLNKVMHPQ